MRIPIHFEHQVINCVIPADTKMAFYRIVQESLHNVQKHAHATEIHVSLSTFDSSTKPCRQLEDLDPSRTSRIQLIIQDNGVGFDKTQVSRDNLGLKIIQERADTIRADLTFDSKPGQGTRIEIIW